jgi:hypothetical protein
MISDTPGTVICKHADEGEPWGLRAKITVEAYGQTHVIELCGGLGHRDPKARDQAKCIGDTILRSMDEMVGRKLYPEVVG